jgi:hypothetical protein
MGCGSSTSSRGTAEPSNIAEPHRRVGSLRQLEAYHHEVENDGDTALATNEPLLQGQGQVHALDVMDTSLDASQGFRAEQSAKKFAQAYVQTLLVKYRKTDAATRAQRLENGRYLQNGGLQEMPGTSAGVGLPGTWPVNSKLSREAHHAPARNQCREVPFWISASMQQSAASTGSQSLEECAMLSLQESYTLQFEDKPPRLRPMLRKARSQARKRAEAEAAARQTAAATDYESNVYYVEGGRSAYLHVCLCLPVCVCVYAYSKPHTHM